VQIDGMGTSNRSKAFHDVAWKNLGDAGFPDRILWHKAVAATYRYYQGKQSVRPAGHSGRGSHERLLGVEPPDRNAHVASTSDGAR